MKSTDILYEDLDTKLHYKKIGEWLDCVSLKCIENGKEITRTKSQFNCMYMPW